MPIPTPSKGEEQNDFISRCMSDEVMKREYPAQNQRSGVCYSQWRQKESDDTSNLDSTKNI